jgi:hypothetical protein
MTTPSSGTKQPQPPFVVVKCVAGPPLACTATLPGEGDVTASAAWSAAESFRLAMDLPVTASSAVVFREPGVPTAISARNVYIRADYYSPRWRFNSRSIASHAYALTPDGGATPLAYISGGVYAGPTATSSALPDAAVTIVAGEGLGKGAMTGVNGSFMIEFLRLGEPFTIQASKAGYTTDAHQSPGIVDNAGSPSNTSFQFSLQPAR